MRIRFDAPILGEIDLGRIRVPIGTFVSVVRGAVRRLERFDDSVAGAVGALTRVLDIEGELEAAEAEHRAAGAIKDEADERIAETSRCRARPRDRPSLGGRRGRRATDGAVAHSRRQPVHAGQRRHRPPAAVRMGERAGARPRRRAQPCGNARLDSSAARPCCRGRRPRPSGGGRPRAGVRQPAQGARLRFTAAQGAARAPTTGLAAGLAAAPSRRPLAAGANHALGGVTLKPLPAGTAFPPRIPGVAAPRPGAGADRPVLVVEIDVPAAMLHEGINALACTLVPGPASRRIERAVSFLHVAAAPAPSRAPTMPGRRTVAPLPPAIAAVLAGRAVALPPPSRKRRSRSRCAPTHGWRRPPSARRRWHRRTGG